MMRLFVAIPLPEPAHVATAGTLRDFRDEGWPVRWIRDEGIHITLKFFGEVLPDRLETITEMLGFCVLDMKPMSLSVTSGGVFPHRSKPRIIRLDVEATPELELLQDRIERGGERIGFPPEGRPFHPHITLGRVREGHRLPPDAVDRLEAVAPQPAFVADRVVLYESTLTPQGPAYQAQTEFVLS